MSNKADIQLRFPWIPLLFGGATGLVVYGLGYPDRAAVLAGAATGMGCWIGAVVVVLTVALAVASKGGR